MECFLNGRLKGTIEEERHEISTAKFTVSAMKMITQNNDNNKNYLNTILPRIEYRLEIVSGFECRAAKRGNQRSKKGLVRIDYGLGYHVTRSENLQFRT